MKKIIQFGEGVFLRTFVDLYFDTLNKEGNGEYEVCIVKPTPRGNLDKFNKQHNKYHAVLRGFSNGKPSEDVYPVDVIGQCVNPFTDHDAFLKLAADPEAVAVVSNTTEAGIAYNENDKADDFANITYPAKLTRLLYERYKSGLNGLYVLPCELIDDNAAVLKECVDKYISLWNLGEDFRKWNNEQNVYCSTLVDRIVSGYPKDDKTLRYLTGLIGEEDELMSVGEPFGLWVIENKGNVSELIKDGHHNIDVLFTDDVSSYKKRKVRVLNGSHTNLVPISLWLGKETVRDVMDEPKLRYFVEDTLREDIVPFVGDDISSTEKFADAVLERFMNPYLNHQLTSIALNSVSKWKSRDLPSFIDYVNANGRIPRYLTIGFTFLVNLYMHIEYTDGRYVCRLPARDIEIRDEEKYLNYFRNNDVHDFMSDVSIWGIDLTQYEGFEDTVCEYLSNIGLGDTVI